MNKLGIEKSYQDSIKRWQYSQSTRKSLNHSEEMKIPHNFNVNSSNQAMKFKVQGEIYGGMAKNERILQRKERHESKMAMYDSLQAF